MKLNSIVLAFVLASGFSVCEATVSNLEGIIPKPYAVQNTNGTFALPAGKLSLVLKGKDTSALKSYLSGCDEYFTIALKPSKANVVIDVTGGEGESYVMDVTPKQIRITSATQAGAFYGLQTLIQIIRTPGTDAIACGKIEDKPRFPYRGVMFDVSRHFRSPEFLKKQIDAMALLKLNKMHLHLTDAAGWRIKIDKYPRLSEFAAWRPQKSWQAWSDNGARYCEYTDPEASGGYYTKEQLKDLVDYAALRNITIIPEIEIPGHSREVTSAYPELSCSGEPYVDEDLCIGKDATFGFIEDVLDEVMEIFPSTYIHIGGDEASKKGWKECPDCQMRMKDEDLKSVDELQSYAIHRVEKYLNSKGRSIIGWDEILEGGLAPNATVMSWRGTEGGIKAIKSGHDVVMTPGQYCYIDYCQDAPFKEPTSIGGYTPLSKVYSYEPLEPELTEDEAKHLLGIQANLWTEYVETDEHAEYMYYPRTLAIAEVAWSRPEKNYGDFHSRAVNLNALLDSAGYNVFDLAHEYGERHESMQSVEHKARGAKVSYGNPFRRQYAAGGAGALTDGVCGGWMHSDQRWQGFIGDFDATVDLGSNKPVNSVMINFMHAPGAWIHLPTHVDFEVSSDGENFTPVGSSWNDVDASYPKIMFKNFSASFAPVECRYIRIKAEKHPRPGGGAWLFTDEIIVN